MLDFDLAKIYGYETRYLNLQVKHNCERFDGDDFMFQLTHNEWKGLMLKNSTSKTHGGKRKLPYAFTEQGVYMLATVLKGPLAVAQSRAIMRAFKMLKDVFYQVSSLNNWQWQILDQKIVATQDRVQSIEKRMLVKSDLVAFANSFNSLPPKSELTVCAGQIVEAQIAYGQIYEQATKSIFIIDNYVSLKTLAMLRNVDQNVASW